VTPAELTGSIDEGTGRAEYGGSLGSAHRSRLLGRSLIWPGARPRLYGISVAADPLLFSRIELQVPGATDIPTACVAGSGLRMSRVFATGLRR